MRILLLFLVFLLVASCHHYDVPMSLNIKGRLESITGSSINDIEGYICADIILYHQGKQVTEKTCGPKSRSSLDGIIYADLYPQVKEKLWFWQSQKSIDIVDYQVYLRSEGKIIRGEFPHGKPEISQIIEGMGETVVVFAIDRMGHDEENFYDVEYLSNYDGDTITFNIAGVHPLLGEKISVRVNGVQTPELKTDDPCEKKAGYFAKNEIASILENAVRIDLKNVERGKYFRIVAEVEAIFSDGSVLDLSGFILENHLGVAYDGDTKPQVDWCTFPGN